MFSPPNPKEFNKKIWEIVKQIPSGKVTTYGRIAAMIAAPKGITLKEYEGLGARWVGSAMAGCPDEVPWQRVINAQGKVSVRKNNEGHLIQKKLLEAEGIEFDAKDRIDLARYEWNPTQPTLGI